MDLAIERHSRSRAARTGQRRNRRPSIRSRIIDIGIMVGVAVLLDETTQGIDAAGADRDRHMIGAARQRRRVEPPIRGGIVDMVIGAIDPPLAIPADNVHAIVQNRGPGHFAARNRQRGTGDPSSR
jgi:hypothetical protein